MLRGLHFRYPSLLADACRNGVEVGSGDVWLELYGKDGSTKRVRFEALESFLSLKGLSLPKSFASNT